MAITEAPYTSLNGFKMLARSFMKYEKRENYVWEPNIPFHTTIEILSSNGSMFLVRDIHTHTQYWFLSSYLVELLRDNKIQNNQVTGEWVVYKHGSSFGIKLV